MRRNPKGVRFNDLCKVCEHYFGKPRKRGTSHRVYRSGFPLAGRSESEYPGFRRQGEGLPGSTGPAGCGTTREKMMVKEVDRYTYRVTWSEDDSEYVGLCAELPSLSWLEETPERALIGIRQLVKETIADLRRAKEPVHFDSAIQRKVYGSGATGGSSNVGYKGRRIWSQHQSTRIEYRGADFDSAIQRKVYGSGATGGSSNVGYKGRRIWSQHQSTRIE